MIVFWDANWVVHIVHNHREIRRVLERPGYVENHQIRVICLPGKPVHEVLDVHGSGTGLGDLGRPNDVVTCLACMGNSKWF